MNTANKFLKQEYVQEHIEALDEEFMGDERTKIFFEYPKKIVNKVESPDIPGMYSLNPYQGCEHGCIYCYARPTHAYRNLSPGVDFETRIFAKVNAAELLRKGRFDEMFFVDMPNEAERESIWRLVIQRHGRDAEHFDVSQLARITDGFTGNVALKLSEGVGEVVEHLLSEELQSTFSSQMGYLLSQRAFRRFHVDECACADDDLEFGEKLIEQRNII